MRDRAPAGNLRESLPFLVGPTARIRPWVPTVIRHQIWRRRTLRACPGLAATRLDRIVGDTLATVDEERLRWLRRIHRGGIQELVELCDYERKLEIAVVNALLAGLHEVPRLRILDLGSGGGYFVAACRQLGHACEGTEVPASRLSPAVAATYAGVATALRVAPMLQLWISAGTPLVLPPRTYDLITAHKICFNGHMRPNPWSVPEWKFFVEDVRRYLAPGGRLVLDLNEDVARYGSRRWYDADVQRYLSSIGRVVHNRVIVTTATR